MLGLLLAVLAGCGGSEVEPRATETPDSSPSVEASSPRGTPAGTAIPSPAPAPTPTRKPPAKPGRIVVLVSVDGLNPDAIGVLGGRLRAFPRLAHEGSSTLNARTSVEITKTLPNHTGILTGRRVSGAAGTGVTFNDDNGGTLERLNGRYVPGVFDIAHDRGLRTALYAEKEKFRFLIRSWAGELDVATIAGPGRPVRDLRAALTSRRPPQLAFLHIATPDVAGHATGFMSRAYLDAVVSADAQIAGLLDTIARDRGLRTRTTVVVTADHGGRGATHGDPASVDNYRIPFFAWGVGVARGADLYARNPGRRDPGRSRPGYDGPQPIRNLDAADLVLRLLGLPGTSPYGVRPLRVR